MNAPFIWLSDREYTEAFDYGVAVQRECERNGRRDRLPQDLTGKSGDYSHGIGMVAERAAAKFLGFPWKSSIGLFKAADLPFEIEVRYISFERGRLKVYPHDADNKKVFGVVISPGRERGSYRLPGWIYARDAKREEWFEDIGNRGVWAYWVPQKNLRPVWELVELIKNVDTQQVLV